MFNFGSAEDNAELFWQDSRRMKGGPKCPDGHYSEMKKKDLDTLFVYLYAALDKAYMAGADDEVINYLTEQYDEVFAYYAEVDDEFRNFVDRGGHHPLPGRYPDAIRKYRLLAGLPASAN